MYSCMDDSQFPSVSMNCRSFVLQVMYGGRVIDDFDRRVVKTYMDEYMGDFIFDTFQPFHFYNNEEVDYFIPKPEKGILLSNIWNGHCLYNNAIALFVHGKKNR